MKVRKCDRLSPVSNLSLTDAQKAKLKEIKQAQLHELGDQQ